jgi:hypothetical protein
MAYSNARRAQTAVGHGRMNDQGRIGKLDYRVLTMERYPNLAIRSEPTQKLATAGRTPVYKRVPPVIGALCVECPSAHTVDAIVRLCR